MESKVMERKSLDLINFIVWLTAGAVIGWFASRMVKGATRAAGRQTNTFFRGLAALRRAKPARRKLFRHHKVSYAERVFFFGRELRG